MEILKKPDWIIHAVPADDAKCDGYIMNYHTHGLVEYDQHELMMSMPIQPEQACSILNNIGMYIVNNRMRLEDGKKYDDFLMDGYHVMVKTINVDDKPVNLIILPDVNDKFFNDEDCGRVYSDQIEMAQAFLSQ